MAMTGTDVRRVGVSDLRGIILDSEEIAKGTEIFDRKDLNNLSRHGGKLYCEAKGSMTAPYRVSLTFSDTSADVKARCTCPAAFRKPFCKHAAALLVAWSRAPEAFVVSEAPPPGAPGGRTKSVKQGAVQKGDLMKQGIAQVSTLVRELGVAGVAAASGDRTEPIKKLGEALRENKLRRLSARTLDLANLLDGAAARKGSLSAVAYTDLVADLLLTARKLEKHLLGEPIDDRHVEELIGKTWQKSDKKPIRDLDLVEYAYQTRTTSDDFVIRESRFFDLSSGAHYSEKQIVPQFLAKRTEPKPSRAGVVRKGLAGSGFPGYPPIRIDIADLGEPEPIDHAALLRLVDKALPDVGSALAALQEHRKDVFAPDLLAAAIRVDTLFARGDRIQAVDDKGHALHLPNDAQIEDRLGTALHEGRLVALLGDVGIDAALPTLWPLAAVFEGSHGLELRSLVDATPDERRRLSPPEPGLNAWIAAARAAGAGAAAISLGEVREELAFAFVLGIAGLSARVTDPLATRLRELHLDKQAALLESLTQRAEPEARLDDFVKLYQILGIALVRLAGATQVDRATLERVPTYESVFVERPAEWLTPDRASARRGAGELNRYEAAVHYARYYGSLPPEELAENIYPIWADGSAAPFVVRAFAGRREQGIAAAKRALGSRSGRVSKITAIQVLEAVGGPEAEEILGKLALTEADAGLRARARDARDALDLPRGGRVIDRRWLASEVARRSELTQELLTASDQETRIRAIHELTSLGSFGAIPALRQAFLGDRAQKVREEAALGLGLLGDTEMTETFVKMLAARGESDRDAKNAAHALGHLGDVRGLAELLAAYAEGYQPGVVAQAIRSLGPVALGPLIALIEARPEIAERKAALSVLAEISDQDLAATLIERLEQKPKDAAFPDVATLYLKLAAVHPDCRRAVAKAILGLLPASEEQRPLGKAAKKALH